MSEEQQWFNEVFVPWVECDEPSSEVMIQWLRDDSLGVDKLRYRIEHPEFLELDWVKNEKAASLICLGIGFFSLDKRKGYRDWLPFWREKFIKKFNNVLALIPAMKPSASVILVPQVLEIARVYDEKLGPNNIMFGIIAEYLNYRHIAIAHQYILLSTLAQIQTDDRLLPLWHVMLKKQRYPDMTYTMWYRGMQQEKERMAREMPGATVLDDRKTYIHMVEERAVGGIAEIFANKVRLRQFTQDVTADLGIEIDTLMKRNQDCGHILRAIASVFPSSYSGGDPIARNPGAFRSHFYDGLKRYGKEHEWPELALNEIEQYCEYAVVDA